MAKSTWKFTQTWVGCQKRLIRGDGGGGGGGQHGCHSGMLASDQCCPGLILGYVG